MEQAQQGIDTWEAIKASGPLAIVLAAGLVALWLAWASERKARETERNEFIKYLMDTLTKGRSSSD